MKLAFADREYMGDESFIKIPSGPVVIEAVRARAQKADRSGTSLLDFRPGDVGVQHPQDVTYAGEERSEGDTSYVCIIDKDRNVVSLHRACTTATARTL